MVHEVLIVCKGDFDQCQRSASYVTGALVHLRKSVEDALWYSK
jgi:hypothetical protein